MKFSLEAATTANQIHAYDDDHIVIRQKDTSELIQLDASLIVTPHQIISDWSINTLSAITEQDIHYLKQFEAEIIILVTHSSKPQLSFALSTQFARQNIAVEFMSLGAACRSYNLLILDDRKVLLAIPFDK